MTVPLLRSPETEPEPPVNVKKLPQFATEVLASDVMNDPVPASVIVLPEMAAKLPSCAVTEIADMLVVIEHEFASSAR